MTIKAIIPAAGLGTRWLPWSYALPKELLPIGNLPILHHVLEEIASSGIREVLIILSEDKEIIKRYFQYPEVLEKRGLAPRLEPLKKLLSHINISYTYQNEPKGLGHAVLQSEVWVGKQPFAVVLPDDLIWGAEPCLAQMVKVYKEVQKPLLALEDIPGPNISSYGVIEGKPIEDRLWKVTGLVEKPPYEEAPSSLAVIGRYILPPEIFSALKSTPIGRGGELQLTDAIASLLSDQDVLGYLFQGSRYDAGTPEGWLKTVQAFFSLYHP